MLLGQPYASFVVAIIAAALVAVVVEMQAKLQLEHFVARIFVLCDFLRQKMNICASIFMYVFVCVCV